MFQNGVQKTILPASQAQSDYIADTLGLIDKVNLIGFNFNLLLRSELVVPNLLPLVID